MEAAVNAIDEASELCMSIVLKRSIPPDAGDEYFIEIVLWLKMALILNSS